MSTTLPTTAREVVIDALVRNLKHLSPHEEWSCDHPLITEYIDAMDEPHRVHHGWVHIAEMLREARELPPGMVREPLRLRGGILFHDIVCVPRAQNNEQKSADFALRFYRGQNMVPIHGLIMATQHVFPFQYFEDDRDIICDLDLSTIGVDKDRFDRYRLNIAKEYFGYCTSEQFDRVTQVFFSRLQDQADRDYIYRTEFFRGRYEEQARENIKRVLSGYVA